MQELGEVGVGELVHGDYTGAGEADGRDELAGMVEKDGAITAGAEIVEDRLGVC